ncbi:MAG: protocatechuate 3,4-dioxygenase subunit beta [Pseudomonadota bacterium]
MSAPLRNAPVQPAPLLPTDWGVQPPALTPAYRTTVLRAPQRPLVAVPGTLTELTGPAFGDADIAPGDDDLLVNYGEGDPIGERIVLHGRVLDGMARAVPDTLVEIWQANAAGRYRHRNDSYLAPLDPNFGGCGRTLTGADGSYAFRTVRPGPYPWPNGPNSWRPAHVHFSVFGTAFAERLITQLYFEGDPLIPLCPIVDSIADPAAVARLTAVLDMDAAVPMDALAYRFDIVLRGRRATPFESRMEGT